MTLRIKVFVPSNAEEVKIHKIIDPYTILVTTNVKNFSNSISRINKKLRIVSKKIDESKEHDEINRSKLAIGTLTVVHKRTRGGIELPAWYCRALIIGFNELNYKYTAFLLDYGDIVEFRRKAFTEISSNIISDPFLTETISLYNIFPAKKYKSKKDKSLELSVETKWTLESIDLTKNLLAVSENYYFDIQTIGADNKKYGELYLVINNKLISLTKALVYAHVAVDCTFDLLNSHNLIKSINPKNSKADRSIEDILEDTTAYKNLMSKAKRSCCDEIFVSSELECKPLENIVEAKFPKTIHEVLKKLHIESLWKVQSYMWPAITKGFDVLAVGPAKHGKTFGFIAPLTNIIIKIKKYQTRDYPMALILCESSTEVINTYSIFLDLLQNYKEIRVIAAHNGCTNRSITAQVFNGCHIFVSTPAFLIRYLSNGHHRYVLNFNYISYLVIDNLDMMIQKHVEALIEFLGKYTFFYKTQQQDSTNLMAFQVIATSRTWSVNVGKFIEEFNNPYICIGSFADATIFCGTKLRTRLILKDEKKHKIQEILGEIYKMAKTMIICADNEEAEELNEYLKEKFEILFVNTKMIFTEISVIKESWKAGVSGMYKLLICTDEVLSDLDITDVDWLIHYSIPAASKSVFLFRFSTLMTNLKKKSTKTEVTIFIDDSNDEQLRGVLNLVQRSGYKFSLEQLNAFEKIYINIERQKKGFAICNNVKTLGSCPALGICTYRHCILPDADAPMNLISIGDRIKFIITYIHSATHFSARISEYIDSEGQRHPASEMDHAGIVSKVLHYYADKQNRRRCKIIVAGGIYGFDKSFDQYQRVEVINVSFDASNAPTVVDLRCIDSGLIYRHETVSKLVELPEEFAKAPAHIVEVFLADIQPYDKETEWNICATECTEQWLKTELRANNFLQAKVRLHLGNTLWVDPLEIRMKIPSRGEIVNSSLKNHLIKNKHGIANENHIKMLMKMCSNTGMMDLPDD